jgi:hypothetical protein
MWDAARMLADLSPDASRALDVLSTRFHPDTRLVGHGLRPPSAGEIGEDSSVAC